jgi:accessory colonization factor AcfC
MENKFKVTATAPTTYQLNSVRAFGYNIKSLSNGSHIFEQEFQTEQEAKEYLTQRAHIYWENSNASEEELREMLSDVEKYRMLTLDAVTGRVEEIEEAPQ